MTYLLKLYKIYFTWTNKLTKCYISKKKKGQENQMYGDILLAINVENLPTNEQ